MTFGVHARRVPLGAEIALAFLVGGASFTLAAVVLAQVDSGLVIVLIGILYTAAVATVARRGAVVYAVPIAMAGMLAYDWYYLPPTHPLEIPDSANLIDLLVYLAVAVLIGELAADGARRAAVSEGARGAIADEQAALRRVATLVAQDVSPREVFGAVSKEVGRLFGTDQAGMIRYQPEATAVMVATWAADDDPVEVGLHWSLDGDDLAAMIWRTGRSGRIDDWRDVPGPAAALVRGTGSMVGSPIIVEGRLWGTLFVHSTHIVPLPADTESRLEEFTELIGVAVANAEARAELQRLLQEQAALRLVATLVARELPPADVFGAVAGQVGQLLDVESVTMLRHELDGTATVIASSHFAEAMRAGTSLTLEGENAAGIVLRTGQAARCDDYANATGTLAVLARAQGIRSTVGAPIVVDGRLWGAILAASRQPDPLPVGAEARIEKFAELVATAIANTQARAEVGRLADEQAALRRVATLVARQASPADVFAAVAQEVARVLGVEATTVHRYEADETVTVVAEWGVSTASMSVGARVPLAQDNVGSLVFRAERPVRVDHADGAEGQRDDSARGLGVRSAVGSPIVVDGRPWGAVIASSWQPEALPAGAESRLGEFAELVATAISNVEARTDLATSRARIVAATDEARRRFERDLHDGVQQRLVSLSLDLQNAATMIPADGPRAELSRVGEGLSGVLEDLRELSRGIHPAILSEGGLGPALKALARRSAVPVELDVAVDQRLDEQVEVAAYYLVSEGLTNAAKHARASVAEVHVEARNGVLDLTVHDDGVGGADPAKGSGLIGLTDRVEALGGTLTVVSSDRTGTSLHAHFPVRTER